MTLLELIEAFDSMRCIEASQQDDISLSSLASDDSLSLKSLDAIINLISSANAKDIQEIEQKEDHPYKGLSPLAVLIKKLTEQTSLIDSQNTRRISAPYIRLLLLLIMYGADVHKEYQFETELPPLQPFTYLCLRGQLEMVRTLYDFFQVTEEHTQKIFALSESHSIKPSIIEYLKNPIDFSHLIPDSYHKLTRNKELVETAILIFQDYCAPLKGIGTPLMKRFLTCHLGRHEDNLLIAELFVKGMNVLKGKFNSALFKDVSERKKDNVLIETHIAELLCILNYVASGREGNQVNPNGSFARRVLFLKNQLKVYIESLNLEKNISKAQSTLFKEPIEGQSLAKKATRLYPLGKYKAEELLEALNEVSGRADKQQPLHSLGPHAHLASEIEHPRSRV